MALDDRDGAEGGRCPLVVRGLVVEISGRRILDGIDLDVAAHERVALLGASGSGKSLTAAAVLGRLPLTASAHGSVRVCGAEVLGMPAARRGRDAGVAALFQDSRTALNPLVHIGAQLVAPLRHHGGLSPQQARSAAAELLTSLGLDDPVRVLRGYPGELSGGQRQRVCMVLALACRPQLLLADEPTTALDVVSQRQVLQVLQDRMAASAAGLLFITHDLAAAAQVCTRAVVLAGGRVVEDAPIAEVLAEPRHDYSRLLVDTAQATRLTPARRAPPTTPAPLLRATGLHRSYPVRRSWARPSPPPVPALRGVDLAVGAGERVGLVGVSGSGKSTLLRILLALDTTDAGTVEFRGRAVRPARTAALRWYRRAVQYIPQDPASSLDPRMNVADLVSEPLDRLRVPGDHRAAVTAALDRVGLPADCAVRRAGELSGGQAQRVAIARAVATGPAVLIADEPVSGIDLPLRDQVVALLERMCTDTGMGLLLVSHDLSVVAALCERTAVLAEGELVEDRPTADLLAAPEHPRTQELLDAVPDLPPAGIPAA
ncbi:ATP-binding cassette domain-containing protein [Pseudonocardia sichuanensis]|uniref:ATP-binding cassette domain-containing protein n=1 Tax=Pseudonocardia kunmingensis TaxID=630975 RepID=UPI001479592A|nr:ABC transporter ATP-binding protein [Pseudonocardia kunmingensis]